MTAPRLYLRRTLFALAVLALAGCAIDSASREDRAKVAVAMERFQTAFKNNSFEVLRPVLAPDFHMYGLPSAMSVDGLKTGLQAAGPQAVEVQILSLKRQPDGIDATVGLYEIGRVAELKIGFTSDGLIRSIDTGMQTHAVMIQVPPAMTSPFVVSRGLMFVRVSVDGRDGYFLVDSGSSGMLLNPRYFHSGRHGVMPDITSGVHGTGRPLGNIVVEDFRWGEFRTGGVDASLKDLSGMETPVNTPLLGAIGHEQLKDCSMTVDWQRREIGIFATDSNGLRKVPDGTPPVARLSFDYYYHVPLLHVSIGGMDHPMMLDSGATVSLLPDISGLGGHFHPFGAGFRLSDGGVPSRVRALCGVVDEARIGPVTVKNIPVLIYRVPYFGDKGLFGIILFKQGRVEVNFRAKELLFR